MKEFGRREYGKTVYVRFDHASPIREVFAFETNVANLLNAIQLHVGFRIIPKETLVVVDEIQEGPGALASLKFFCEEASEVDIIAAGSQLGLSDHVGTGFPVGKVDTLFLYPLSFKEFLEAIGKEQFAELISGGDWEMLSAFHDECIRLLKLYFFIGGMPHVVDDYPRHGDFTRVRHIQTSLLHDYKGISENTSRRCKCVELKPYGIRYQDNCHVKTKNSCSRMSFWEHALVNRNIPFND